MASTLTWFQRTRYTAVAPNSAANAITAIINAVNANATKWVVSASAATYVELKAAGSPSGDLGSARILIFGGASPVTGSLNASVTANTTNLYMCLCVDANTTGPVNVPSVGVAYAGKSRQILGDQSGAPNGSNTYVNIVESDDVIHIGLGQGTANVYMGFTAGRCVVDTGGTARWAIMNCGSVTTASAFTTSTTWVVPPQPLTAGSQTGWCEIDSSGTIRPFGMGITPIAQYGGAVTLLTDGVDTALLPIFLTRSRTFAISATSQTFLGAARQMRFGPAAICGQVMTVSGDVVAYAAGTDLATGTHPCWFTQSQ